MKIQAVHPTGNPQNFEINETFFSTTDRRGVITAGNHVFSRTSGYDLGELLGEPHNIIRHQDMPRCVFHLLWETCEQDKPFMGYVKNQAKNGNHYWVLAIIVPIPTGFLSVRIKPTSPLLTTVEAVYKHLLALENEKLGQGTSEALAAAATASTLLEEIKKLGFPSYEIFSHYCLNEEMRIRDAAIAAGKLRLFPATIAGNGAGESLASLFDHTQTTYERLNALIANLEPFTSLEEGIRKRKDAVTKIADDFRIHALNAHVAAHPLGAEGVVIGTVAQFLNGQARALAGNVAVLSSNIAETTTTVSSVASNISVARIQMEMLLSFLAEIAERKNADETQMLLFMAKDLRSAFAHTLENAVASLASLKRQIPDVLESNELLRKDIIYLQVAQISGMTEAARLRNADNFQTMFLFLRQQVEQAQKELSELGDIVEQLTILTDQTPPKVHAIHMAMHAMEDLKSAN